MEPFNPLVSALRQAHSIDTNKTLRQQVFHLNDVTALVKEQLLILDERAFKEGYLTFGFIIGKTTQQSRDKAIYDLAHLRAVIQETEWKLPLLNAHRGTQHEERAKRILCMTVLLLR